MTRDDFMKHATQMVNMFFDSKRNGVMNLVSQAWAEGKRNAEIEKISGMLLEAMGEKTAKWINEPDRTNHYHCSNCKQVWGIVARTMTYCPNCGRKMEGIEDDNQEIHSC